METRWKIQLTLLLMSLTWMTIDLNSYTRFGIGQSLRDQSQVIHGLLGSRGIILKYHVYIKFWRCDEGSAFRPYSTSKGVFSVMSKISDTLSSYFTLFLMHIFGTLGFISKRWNCYVHELKPGEALSIWLLVHGFQNPNYNITFLTFTFMMDIDVHLVDRAGYKRFPKLH